MHAIGEHHRGLIQMTLLAALALAAPVLWRIEFNNQIVKHLGLHHLSFAIQANVTCQLRDLSNLEPGTPFAHNSSEVSRIGAGQERSRLLECQQATSKSSLGKKTRRQRGSTCETSSMADRSENFAELA